MSADPSLGCTTTGLQLVCTRPLNPDKFLIGMTSNDNLRYTDLSYKPLMSVLLNGGTHLTLEGVEVSVEVEGG